MGGWKQSFYQMSARSEASNIARKKNGFDQQEENETGGTAYFFISQCVSLAPSVRPSSALTFYQSASRPRLTMKSPFLALLALLSLSDSASTVRRYRHLRHGSSAFNLAAHQTPADYVPDSRRTAAASATTAGLDGR